MKASPVSTSVGTLTSLPAVSLLIAGTVTGVLTTLCVLYQLGWGSNIPLLSSRDPLHSARERRKRLPSFIILVRHGESECNADHTLWRTKPDNLVNLTSKGRRQARDAGRRIESVFKYSEASGIPVRRVHLSVSPFERTLQTASELRKALEHRIVRTDIQPRIREQEFGNLQGDEIKNFRKEQKRVGRFWYRFPTGESGADVYDRVKSWWDQSVLTVNERYGYDPIDALVVVTHGLTMRFVLMQLYGWSPTTFHSVWNAGNCNVYVLKKDLSKPGTSPYILDEECGDVPHSSIDVLVEFQTTSPNSQVFQLHNYLAIPPPRTQKLNIVKQQLAQQYPNIQVADIAKLTFLPFIDGARGIKNYVIIPSCQPEEDSDESDEEFSPSSFKRVDSEVSLRFPSKGLETPLNDY